MYVINRVIDTAMGLLGQKYDSPAARVMLLAIGLQESRFEHRRQIKGPARGYWQFEKGGGVKGVMTHRSSVAAAQDVCEVLNYPFDRDVVFDALDDNSILAAAFARLLLWTDPAPLPALGDHAAAWDYYERNWRPGKPHPETWFENYQKALQALS